MSRLDEFGALLRAHDDAVKAGKLAEIVGPSGRVHYRRPADDPLVLEAYDAPGYSVRYVDTETVEPVSIRD